MSRRSVKRHYSNEELVAALLAAANKLGRPPTLREFQRESGIASRRLQRRFGSYRAALRTAGFVFLRREHISSAALLQDWARVARKLGHAPSSSEYRKLGKYEPSTMQIRFQRWSRTPECFLHYLKSGALSQAWADVSDIALRGIGRGPGCPQQKRQASAYASGPTLLPPPLIGMQRVTLAVFAFLFSPGPSRGPRRFFADRPLMGPPLALPGLAHEPVNEIGVVFLFGMIAHRLGFLVESMRTAFPDCEAKREVKPGLWQRVRLEFEYESRNFLCHKHDPAGCDLIVCWKDTWLERPEGLEVLELKSALGTLL